MTTKDIIKILPFDAEYRAELLANIDSLNADQKFELEKIIWRAYREYYQMRLDANLQLAFAKAGENQEKLDQEFYKRVREKTDKEMQEETTNQTQAVDLETARKAMERIIKEIQATKNNSK